MRLCNPLYIINKLHPKPRHPIFPRPQREPASVLDQHLADKDQADALPRGFGGEEGSEEFGFRLAADAFAVIADFEGERAGLGADADGAALADGFCRVLDDIHQDLLEEGAVDVYRGQRVVQLHADFDLAVHADGFHEAFAGDDQFVERGRSALRLGNAYDVGEVGDEAAHAVTPLDGGLQEGAYVLHPVCASEGCRQGVERRGYPCRRIVYLVGNHADDFLVGFLLGLEDFLGQHLDEVEVVAESSIHKERMGAFIDVRIADADYLRRPGGYLPEFVEQRRVYSVDISFFREVQETSCRRIEALELFVQIEHDDPHRRGFDKQVEEMILLAEAEPFVLQLLHDAVENIDDAVGLHLSHAAQPGAEVLFFQQVHPVGYCVNRLDDAVVEVDKVEQDNDNQSFGNEQQFVVLLPDEQVGEQTCCREDEKDEDKEKGI